MANRDGETHRFYMQKLLKKRHCCAIPKEYMQEQFYIEIIMDFEKKLSVRVAQVGAENVFSLMIIKN